MKVKFTKGDGYAPFEHNGLVQFSSPVPIKLPKDGRIRLNLGVTTHENLLMFGTAHLRMLTQSIPAQSEVVVDVENVSGADLQLEETEIVARALPLSVQYEVEVK